MYRNLPDPHLAQTLAWIWLGVLVVGLSAWFVYRQWRKRHPPSKPATETTYSQRLQQRLSKHQGSTSHGKRRERPPKGPTRR